MANPKEDSKSTSTRSYYERDAIRNADVEIDNATEIDDEAQSSFDTWRSTHNPHHQVRDDNRDTFADLTRPIRERIQGLLHASNAMDSGERRRVLDDIEISKQYMEMCKVADQGSVKKVYKVGEVIAENRCDQIVVTTQAETFEVGKVWAKDDSCQMLASVSSDEYLKTVDKRYDSRGGAAPRSDSVRTQSDVPGSASTVVEVRERTGGGASAPTPSITSRSGNPGQSSEAGPKRHGRPSPNENRKRQGYNG